MAYVKMDWTEIQPLMGEEGFEENCIATEKAGVYLVDEDWLNE